MCNRTVGIIIGCLLATWLVGTGSLYLYLTSVRPDLLRESCHPDPDHRHRELELFEDLRRTGPKWNVTRVAPVLFFQGNGFSQALMAKYTGTRGFISSVGDLVWATPSMEIIHTGFIGAELAEVHLRSCRQAPCVGLYDPVAVYHCVQHTAYSAVFRWWGIHIVPLVADAGSSITSHSIEVGKLNLGQDGDIFEHKRRWDLLTKQLVPGTPIILFGMSRGAATTLNALRHYHYPGVRLVILEGCYLSIPKVLAGMNPVERGIRSELLSHTGYRSYGMAPEHTSGYFPYGITFAFITSDADTRVPSHHGESLAKKIAQWGRNPVYLLTLHGRDHVSYHEDPHYLHFVHALYRSLDLPYIPEYAVLGERLLQGARVKN